MCQRLKNAIDDSIFLVSLPRLSSSLANSSTSDAVPDVAAVIRLHFTAEPVPMFKLIRTVGYPQVPESERSN